MAEEPEKPMTFDELERMLLRLQGTTAETLDAGEVTARLAGLAEVLIPAS